MSVTTPALFRMGRAMLVALLLAGPAAAGDKPPGQAVASAHPLATQAGIEILEAGGNAFDAAVAVSAALAVVEPASSGIGGGGFWLLRREADGKSVFVDGRETAPFAAREDMYLGADGKAVPKLSRDGALAAGIPGAPAAWAHIAARYGSRPLAELLAPAIRYAHDGFAIDEKLAKTIAQHRPRLSVTALALLAPGGRPLPAGAVLKQPELADTLKALADQGAKAFYTGDLAAKLVAGVKAGGGIWADTDLLRYRVVERRPLVTWFRGYRVVTAPPPSAGGVALAQVLQQLEALGWSAADPVRSRHLVVEALRRAYRDRLLLGDPDTVYAPLTQLTSRDHALALARSISMTAATPSAQLTPPAGGNDTTHFSILDAAGNQVAGTLSINLPLGSGFLVPGTGVLLNNEMDDFAAAPGSPNAYGLVGSKANAIAPGKRMLSSMTPTIVEGPNGLLIVGTPGGSRIISMVLLGVLGFVQGLDATQVVSLPRYHHQYLPDEVQFEPGALSAAEQSGLAALGHVLKPQSSTYGNMHAVIWQPRGQRLEAASDPRGVGAARVVLLAPPAQPAPSAQPVPPPVPPPVPQ